MNIAVIGSGIVGQATGIGLVNNGNEVIFNDVNRSKLIALSNNGYETTDNLGEAVSCSEVIFVSVPTPTIREGIDLTYIKECTRNIAEEMRNNGNYVLIVYRSTIIPQTTRTKLIPILETFSHLTAGQDFGVCMNPEFLREKTPLEDFLNPCRIVIGELDIKSGNILEELYSNFRCPLIRTDLDTAEMIKYASNMYLAAKISYFNEIFLICHKLGLDAKIVSETASLDSRIGKYGVVGGKPFAGMCLPKDLSAFINFAKTNGLNPKLLQAIAEVNQEINLYSTNEEIKI
jgi:UDPglucose 6-dehydrogenase